MQETLRQLLEALISQTAPSVPTLGAIVFAPIALLVAFSALMVGLTRNLFHSSLFLVATLFGVAGIYITLEAEFVAISQVLVYVGAISTLITFAIMLTRGMMFGGTSPINRQTLAAATGVALLFFVLVGVLTHTPWPSDGSPIADASWIIPTLGELFVTTYLIPFELLALLLLVALAGAILLARDRK
jgi:NADH-quinone oxidoreductase subunit J